MPLAPAPLRVAMQPGATWMHALGLHTPLAEGSQRIVLLVLVLVLACTSRQC